MIRRATIKNNSAVVIVCGCYSEVSSDDVSQIEGVSYVIGSKNKLSVVDRAIELLNKKQVRNKVEIDSSELFEPMQVSSFSRTRAYVKIEDGCENNCAYCIIPTARGKICSKPVEEAVREIKNLADNGCHEVVLTGIETAAYGRDFNDKDALITLMKEIDKIDGIERIRLGSLEPSFINPALTERFTKVNKLCPHFHVSLQSGCDSTLARMRRKYNTDMVTRNLEVIRAGMPDVLFCADLIVGFPGESEEEFNTTLDFLEKTRFFDIHVFPYSKRKNTVASNMENQLPKSVKHERVMAVQALQEKIKREYIEDFIKRERVFNVLFETYENSLCTGHTENFIEVRMESKLDLRGHFVKVVLTGYENGCVFAKSI